MGKVLNIPQWISLMIDNWSRRPYTAEEYEKAIAYLQAGRKTVTNSYNLKLLDMAIATLEENFRRSQNNAS